ncbi:LamG domain-containing protein [Candidatus Pacearchaeota archaeon]|nr:LamG domain-containing protein [Candidatus Pacearchaeota archaeon]
MKRGKGDGLHADLSILILLLAFGFILLVSSGEASLLTCSFNTSNTTCSGAVVWYQQNDSGGFHNAHLQNVTNSSFSPRYNYTLCCSATDTLSNSCEQASVLKISNITNAHAQTSNFSGTAYSYDLCLAANPGKVLCKYEVNTTGSTCPTAGYTCLASMASSESGDSNQTNAHAGPCTEYSLKICCTVDSPPSVTNVVLNATSITNYTTENLTLSYQINDPENITMTNVTDWRKEGKSLALLNLAFATNVSDAVVKSVRDYSTYVNNATLGGGISTAVPKWNSNGKIGGSYDFDGVNDWINVSSNLSSFNSLPITVSAWFKMNTTNSNSAVVNKYLSGSNNGYHIFFNGARVSSWYYCNSTSLVSPGTTVTNYSDNKWHHTALIVNTSGGFLYMDGSLALSSAWGAQTPCATSTNLSVRLGIYTSYFNGSIDEVTIFNDSLSFSQLSTIYREGLNNHSINTWVAEETTKGENWSVAITPSDGYNDGATVVSNTLRIRNSPPNVTLISPPNANSTTSRSINFTWSSSDNDGDNMSYQLNITRYPFPSGGDNRLISTAATSHLPNPELAYLADYSNYYYNWTVRANDSDEYGAWAGERTLNITALIMINATVDLVQFGSIDYLAFNDTNDNSPAPFVIQNDGNTYLNVTVSATQLWRSVNLPSKHYKFKANFTASEGGAFKWASSTTSYTNMTSSAQLGIAMFNYTNVNDTAEFDIYVEVPAGEPAGNRNSTITFDASLGGEP